MIRFTTENSVYEINDAEDAYRRREGAIKQPVDSDRLTYDYWHPLARFALYRHPDGSVRLRLWRTDSVLGIATSPVLTAETRR